MNKYWVPNICGSSILTRFKSHFQPLEFCDGSHCTPAYQLCCNYELKFKQFITFVQQTKRNPIQAPHFSQVTALDRTVNTQKNSGKHFRYFAQIATYLFFYCYTVQQIYKLLNQLFALVSFCSKNFYAFKTFLHLLKYFYIF